jgi:hypothetical protein
MTTTPTNSPKRATPMEESKGPDVEDVQPEEPPPKRVKCTPPRTYLHRFRIYPAKVLATQWEAYIPKAAIWGGDKKYAAAKATLKHMIREATVDPDTGIATLRVVYRSKHENDRLIARTSIRKYYATLQNLSRRVKQTICDGLYQNMDIVNCMPTSIRQWAVKEGLDVPALGEYVDDRKNRLQEFMDMCNLSRDDAKGFINSVMNSGTRWKRIRNQPAWLGYIANDIAVIANHIKDHHQDIWDFAVEDHKTKDREWDNIEGCAMARLYRILEATFLDIMEDTLRDMGHIGDDNDCSLENDGLMTTSMTVTEDDLRAMEARVFEETGYAVNIVFKPFDEIIPDVPLSGNDFDNVRPTTVLESHESHNEAAAKMMEYLAPIIRKCDGTLFVKIHGVWTNDPERANQYLLRMCLNANFIKISSKGADMPFSSCLSNAKGMVAAIVANLDDDPKFYEHLLMGTQKKLCFTDGYWDYELGHFVEGLDGVDTMITTGRPFPKTRDEDTIKEVYRRIITPVLGFKKDNHAGTQRSITSYFGSAPPPTTITHDIEHENHTAYLHVNARAVAGNPDKISLSLVGRRNTGKSKLDQLLAGSIGGYHHSIASGNLLSKPSSDDPEKDNKVFIECEGARIVSTQEIKSKGDLDGAFIKCFQAVNEKQSGRLLHKNSRNVYVTGTLNMNHNGSGKMDPVDANEFNIPIRMPHMFVDADTKERDGKYDRSLVLKDPSIDAWILRDDVRDAFTWIMIDAYTDKPFEFQDYPLLLERRNAQMDDTDEGSMWDFFEVTGNPHDTITHGKFKSVLAANKIHCPSMDSIAEALQVRLQAQLQTPTLDFAVSGRVGDRGDRKRIFRGIKQMATPEAPQYE